MTKIKHNIVCYTCGKPADYNISNEYHRYSIDENGDYDDTGDSWAGDETIDVCVKCYDKGDY